MVSASKYATWEVDKSKHQAWPYMGTEKWVMPRVNTFCIITVQFKGTMRFIYYRDAFHLKIEDFQR